jgi:hypothetical protein
MPPSARASRHERLITPRQRHRRAAIQPSRAESALPIGEFMSPASDPMGRNVSLSITTPPLVRRHASSMVAKGMFGFQTEQDVFRWCLEKGLELLSLQARDEQVTSIMAMLHSWAVASRAELENMFYENNLRGQVYAVETLIVEGHTVKALKIAETLWEEHDRIDDIYWRGKYRKVAKGLLDRARTAQIMVDQRTKERRKHPR